MGPQRVSDADEEAEMAATQWELDVDQDDPEVGIVEVVSELEDQPVESLPPVYETIDNIIAQLFSDPPPAEAQAMVQFTYSGYRIDVQQSGDATFMNVSDNG